MGYFKRKRTNKKKGKRGTKRYRGGATNATNGSQSMSPTNQPISTTNEMTQNAQTKGESVLPADLEEKINDIVSYIKINPNSKGLINQKMTEILSN
jgi:hypothetical protein